MPPGGAGRWQAVRHVWPSDVKGSCPCPNPPSACVTSSTGTSGSTPSHYFPSYTSIANNITSAGSSLAAARQRVQHAPHTPLDLWLRSRELQQGVGFWVPLHTSHSHTASMQPKKDKSKDAGFRRRRSWVPEEWSASLVDPSLDLTTLPEPDPRITKTVDLSPLPPVPAQSEWHVQRASVKLAAKKRLAQQPWALNVTATAPPPAAASLSPRSSYESYSALGGEDASVATVTGLVHDMAMSGHIPSRPSTRPPGSPPGAGQSRQRAVDAAGDTSWMAAADGDDGVLHGGGHSRGGDGGRSGASFLSASDSRAGEPPRPWTPTPKPAKIVLSPTRATMGRREFPPPPEEPTYPRARDLTWSKRYFKVRVCS